MTYTPPPEAIEAAANQYKSQTHEVSISDDLARKRARMILVAAAPFIVSAKTAEGAWTMTDAEFKRELAKAKAEALREAADECEYLVPRGRAYHWLRASAATIESEAS